MASPSAAPSSGCQVGVGVAGAGLGGGPEEQRGLEALAADGEDRDEDERTSGALGGVVELAAQLAG